MNYFGIHFLICNFYISIFIILLILIKKGIKKHITDRTQYNLWFILFIILIIPFLNISINQYITLNMNSNINMLLSQINTLNNNKTYNNQIYDFAISINSQKTSQINYILIGIWVIGIMMMLLVTIKSIYTLHKIKQSALPVQNKMVISIYHSCLLKANTSKSLPIYSTAFLKSPVLTGFFKPRIYIPIHLISDFNENDLCYMLLHEINHYLYKDSFINLFMNLIAIVYWFNPVIWYALNEMKIEREVACDISTLKMLDEKEYINYGYTLVHFAQKTAHLSFPFTSSISSNLKQMKRRILKIKDYKRDSITKKLKSIIIYFIIFIMSLGFIPLMPTYAKNHDYYNNQLHEMNIVSINHLEQLTDYSGTFVLYDSSQNLWSIYNEKQASMRVSPYSTYKIYDALLGLEKRVITPDNSTLLWNNERYPFQEWEANQDLNSAMKYSVNWYFQNIDQSLGLKPIRSFLQEIEYGNQTTSQDLDMYWSDSSLKISAIEQVELLIKLHDNSFGFTEENINAVKDSIYLSSSKTCTLYGKTGTGRIDNRDVSGWFIGYIEIQEHVYYFATHIQGQSNANGSKASEITMSILSDMNIW